MDESAPDIERLASACGDMIRRIPRLAWPFIILAGLELLVAFGAYAATSGTPWTADLFVSVGINFAWALLPVAVLIGCPTAWMSARGVLIGAIAWSTFGVANSLIWSALPSNDWAETGSPERSACALVVLGAAIAGPAIVAVSLDRRRWTSTTWPAPMVLIAIAGVAAACVYQWSAAQDWYNYQQSSGVQDNLAPQLQLVASAVRPLKLLTLGMLAWSSLSAVRAGEKARSFWRAMLAGSATLLVVQVVLHVEVPIVSIAAFSSNTLSFVNAVNEFQMWATAVGIALLLLALAMGAPRDPLDLGDVVADPGAAET